ncbi:MAG: UDP-N-acetylmuramoyl-tripeptide--D-alanyl-D-alanine ligase [Bacillota bacterium]|nr:UDP-N-acetylmuramoyl-tripeptide--D-alanyl-D-alanine ligase [Bacillota bacterium]
MKPTSVHALAEWSNGTIIGSRVNVVMGVKIDSREATLGDMFVCVVGEKNNGHKFIQSAYNNGCRCFLISQDVNELKGASYIKVDDTVAAFCKMSEEYLKQFKIRKIAVTGSVGKTTTKMLTATVFASRYNTITTKKNLNTDLGLAMTCFDVDDKTEAAVFEMGMDKPGEIAGYVSRVKPELGIITNVGISHLERLGTRDAIADAKLEIVNEFDETNILVVNSSSDYLKTKQEIRDRATNKSQYRIVSVGQDLLITDIKNIEGGIMFKINDVDFEIPLIGEHNAIDAALAAAAGMQFGISLQKSASALKSVEATEKRLNVEKISDIILIDDSYNASPDSVKAGIAAIASVKARRRIVVLGDMLELGSESDNGHISVGECVGKSNIDILIAVGNNKGLYKKGLETIENTACKFMEFETLEDTKAGVLKILKADDAVIIKGSNSTKVSEIAQYIRENYHE